MRYFPVHDPLYNEDEDEDEKDDEDDDDDDDDDDKTSYIVVVRYCRTNPYAIKLPVLV